MIPLDWSAEAQMVITRLSIINEILNQDKPLPEIGEKCNKSCIKICDILDDVLEKLRGE